MNRSHAIRRSSGLIKLVPALVLLAVLSVSADNPMLTVMPDLRYDGQQAAGSVSVDEGTGSIVLTTTESGTWQYKPVGTETLSTLPSGGGTLVFADVIGDGESLTYDLVYTASDGSTYVGTLTIHSATNSGSYSSNNVSNDSSARPDYNGDCAGDQCCPCNECDAADSSGSSGASSGSEEEPRSLRELVELPVDPNEPDFREGALMLYRARIVSGDNVADRDHLRYVSTATMEVLTEDNSPSESGLWYTCTIRQASGIAIQYEIRSTESLGRPVGPYIHSGSRIELLDGVNGSVVTSNPASATHIRQYRQNGGIMVFAKSTGLPAQYTTRTGRVTTSPGNLAERYESSGKLSQIKTAAGLLKLTEISSRKYQIERFLPSQVSGSGPYSTTGAAILTVTIEHPESSNTVSVTRAIDGRTVLHEWTYSTTASSNEWSLTRKVSNGAGWDTAWTKALKTQDGGASNILTRTWKSPAGTAFYSAGVTGSTKEWGEAVGTSGSASDGFRSVLYHEDSASPGSYGKLSHKQMRDGRREYYDYDSSGRMTLRRSYWLDSLSSKHEIFDYSAHAGETLLANDYRPRTTTVKVEGGTKTISKTMFAATVLSGEYTEITKRAATPSAGWSDSANLVTTRTYYGSSAGSVAVGRLKSVTAPDGDVTAYTYAAGSGPSDALTVTASTELGSGGSPIAGRSRRSITVYDALGRVRTITRGVYVDGTTGWKDYEKTTDSYSAGSNGPFGYRYQREVQDLIGSNSRILAEWTWSGGRVIAETDENQVETSFGYDLYDRVATSTREAVPAFGSYAAQSAIVTSVTDSTPLRSGESITYADKTTEVSGGSLVLVSSEERDDWGRLTSRTDENGYTTSIVYTNSGRTVTTTRADGETEIRDYHYDGKPKSLTGTGVVAQYHSYAADGTAGTVGTTTYLVSSPNARYQTSLANMLGQAAERTAPALNGTTATSVTETMGYESGTGELESVASTAANTPYMLYSDNADKTERTVAISTDSTMSLGADRPRTATSTFEFDGTGNKLWSVRKSYVYPEEGAGASTPKLVSTEKTLLGGFTGAEIAKTELVNELSGETTVRWVGRDAGVHANVVDYPETSTDEYDLSYCGRRAWTIGPSGWRTVTYGYDGLGRLTSVVHPRTGATTTSYLAHPTLGSTTTLLVGSVTTNGSDTTSYTYWAQGDAGAGQVKSETLPPDSDGNTANDTRYNAYTSRGELMAVWGAGTYTTWREYDAYGELFKLHTWRTDPGLAVGSLPGTPPTGSSVTTWNRDAGTGLPLNKRYDPNGGTAKGPDYEYDTAGRIKTRSWARQEAGESGRLGKGFNYNAYGELSSYTYANDPNDTPPCEFLYDRLGRLTHASEPDDFHTHVYGYDSSTLVRTSELINYDLDQDGDSEIQRSIVYQHDQFLRSSGFGFGESGFTTPETSSGYQYDNDGRLNRVWHEPSFSTGIPQGAEDFTYSYRYQSSSGDHVGSKVLGTLSGLPFFLSAPVHEVINTYESGRNVLKVRKNEEKTGTDAWSKYSYSVNARGQRTALGLALDKDVDGAGITSSDVDSWGYNSRGELVSSDHETTDHKRGYAYDAIGNRTEDIEETTTLTATDNYESNALNQYDEVHGTAWSYDDDGNLLSDGTLNYTWDAENRLIRVDDGTNTIAEYLYDYLGRRIGRATTSHAPQGAGNRIYFYEGWNLIAEFTSNSSWGSPAHDFSYTWGLDLSQSLQGAGGVAGLLVAEKVSGTNAGEYYPTFDGNGNVSEYLNSSGVQVAHYEYDPFGKALVLADSGTFDDLNGLFAHRFSTKYFDEETGYYYYGYRYLDPATGRWPSRDPIGRLGGVNVYALAMNDGVNGIDFLGLSAIRDCSENVTEVLFKDGAARALYKAVSDAGCAPVIVCRCADCDGEDWPRPGDGETFKRTKWNTVRVDFYVDCCGASVTPREDVRDVLVHELVHARDYCQGWLINGDCRSQVCSELKAYSAQEDRDFLRGLPADVRKNLLTSQAASSAQGHCDGGYQEAKNLGMEIYEECVGKDGLGRIY